MASGRLPSRLELVDEPATWRKSSGVSPGAREEGGVMAITTASDDTFKGAIEDHVLGARHAADADMQDDAPFRNSIKFDLVERVVGSIPIRQENFPII